MKITKGTATATGGSHIVTGTGTTWLDDGVRAGHIFELEGVLSGVQISRVISNTLLHLATRFKADDGKVITAPYVIVSNFTPHLDLPYPSRGDEDIASIVKRAFEVIDKIGPT